MPTVYNVGCAPASFENKTIEAAMLRGKVKNQTQITFTILEMEGRRLKIILQTILINN